MMRKYKAWTAVSGPLAFIIEHDPDIGFWVYTYRESDMYAEDLKNDFCKSFQEDIVQDSLEMAKGYILEDHGVPADAWKKIS